jgi:hypothetical protein
MRDALAIVNAVMRSSSSSDGVSIAYITFTAF